MNLSNQPIARFGILYGLLLAAFIILKLCGVVDSWWFVLSPLWIPLALVLIIFGAFLLLAAFFR